MTTIGRFGPITTDSSGSTPVLGGFTAGSYPK